MLFYQFLGCICYFSLLFYGLVYCHCLVVWFAGVVLCCLFAVVGCCIAAFGLLGGCCGFWRVRLALVCAHLRMFWFWYFGVVLIMWFDCWYLCGDFVVWFLRNSGSWLVGGFRGFCICFLDII